MFNFGKANLEQRKAIEATEGPVLIVAGPGTGKTFTLVKRVAYLIVEKNVAPEKIMITTFTEKAAKEIITRTTNELLALNISLNVNDLYVGTIHSICLRLIKEHLEFTRLKKNFRMLDQFEQQYLVFQNIKRFKEIENGELVYGDSESSWAISEKICYYVNAVLEELVNIAELEKSSVLAFKALSKVLKVYQKILNEENALDFSSIQSIAYELIKDNECVKKEIQEKINYLMIDEYQDTNYVQEQIVFLIAGEHKNICVVGDDDQGLYRFRGATIRNILEFPLKFNDCKQFKLVENYRSEKDIVNFYNEWMITTNGEKFEFEWGKYRFDKNIKVARPNLADGVPTVMKIAGKESQDNWNENVLEFINKLKKSGKVTDLNQIAFLFRSVKHDKNTALAKYLEANGVPVYSPRSNMYFEREEIKLLIGALMMMFPKYVGKLAEEKFFIRPELSSYYVDCLKTFKSYLDVSKNEELTKWIKFRANDHINMEKNLDYAMAGLMYQLFEFEPFHELLSTDVTSGVADTRAIRNIAIFTDLVGKFEYLHRINVFTVATIDRTVEMFFNMYLMFLIDGGINEYEDKSEYAPKGCISFMTIHQSKGLEFPVVVVGSLYGVPRKQEDELLIMLEDEFYQRKPFEPRELTKYFDFWRLYYTAFSRAQNLLVLTAREKEGHGAEPSKYFKQVYEELPNYWDRDIDYSKFDFEKVKDVNIKQSYTFTSDISVYETCATQFKYYKELGFLPLRVGATLFGTVVHETIEDIHKTALRNESEKITKENIAEWFEINYANLSKKEHAFLAQKQQEVALEQVQKYAESHNGGWCRIKDAEVEVSHVKEDYILTGKVDLMEGEGNTYEIIDFKAEKKPDLISENLRIQRYRRQLEVCAYILENRLGINISKLHLYYTGESDENPTISFDKDESRIGKTIEELDEVVRKIQAKNFKGKADVVKTCRNCDLRFYCKRN